MIAALLTLGVVMWFIFGGGMLAIPIFLFICLLIGFCMSPSAEVLPLIIVLGGGGGLLIYTIYHKPKYGNCGLYVDQKLKEYWKNRSSYILENFYDLTPNEKYRIQEYWKNSKTKNYINWEKKFHVILNGKIINQEQYTTYCSEQDNKLYAIDAHLQKFSKYYIACNDTQKKIIDFIFSHPYSDWEKVKDRLYHDH